MKLCHSVKGPLFLKQFVLKTTLFCKSDDQKEPPQF